MAGRVWTGGDGLLGDATALRPLESAFCTKETLDYATALTTQRLQATGLPPLPTLRTLDEDNRVRLLNLLDSVLRLKDEAVASAQGLDQKYRTMTSDLDTAQLRLTAKTKEASDAEREVANLRLRLETTEKNLRTATADAKDLKAKLEITVGKGKSKDAQAVVEMRKREMELNKVKERLLKVADKPVSGAAGSKPSIRIINPLPTVRATAAGRTAAAEQPVDESRLLIASYDEREKELLAENAELRQALLRIQRGIQEMADEGGAAASGPLDLASPVRATGGSGRSAALASDESFEVMQLRMPYELVKGVVQENARTALEELRLQMSVLRDELDAAQQRGPAGDAAGSAASGRPTEAALQAADQARREAEARLWQLTQEYEQEKQVVNLQIEEYKRIMQEQERLLEESLAEPIMAATMTPRRPGAALDTSMTTLDLSQEREALAKLKADIVKERQQLTDAFAQLGHERQAVQRDRSALESERRSHETAKLLETFPPTPDWLRAKSGGGATPAVTPLKPSNRPAVAAPLTKATPAPAPAPVASTASTVKPVVRLQPNENRAAPAAAPALAGPVSPVVDAADISDVIDLSQQPDAFLTAGESAVDEMY